MNIKCYSELVLLPTFEERFEYLRLDGIVGETTFGFDRYMNQVFYRSLEWKKIRDAVIARDLGCDLGIEGHEIFGRVDWVDARLRHCPVTADTLDQGVQVPPEKNGVT